MAVFVVFVLPMSKVYKQEKENQYKSAISNLLENAPSYVKDFALHMNNGKRSLGTQRYYLDSVMAFISFEKDMIPEFSEIPIKEFPVEVFSVLTVKDINEYRTFLHEARFLTNSYIKTSLAPLSVFYKFLNSEGIVKENPMLNFEAPATNKHKIIKLDSELSNRLLDGILKNDMYLSETETGMKPLPIPEKIWTKREAFVLRNYAIVTTFLGTGLRVSELVGLDMEDINLKNNRLTVIAKGGDEREIYFGDQVAAALRTYLYGIQTDDIIEFCNSYVEGSADWCLKHSTTFNILSLAKEEYPDMDEDFYRAMVLLASSQTRKSRIMLSPAPNCHAVFISKRGQRVSERMVQIMVKEMVQTYLPDYDDKDLFSPHKLRSTCASRILTQTGDIALAAVQLNHANIQTTANFYAELQKEKQKDKIKELDINKW